MPVVLSIKGLTSFFSLRRHYPEQVPRVKAQGFRCLLSAELTPSAPPKPYLVSFNFNNFC